ncbi:MAG: GNAT family N-acetyltransferase [Clostridiales bacterium]|nr:GNAT family N-acetyltransferase [Clostridiales bacterium]
MNYTINEERLTPEDYIGFLRHTDLGSQYPAERFRERTATLVSRASISLTARDAAGELVGVCFGITDFAYWLFITDLGVRRDWVGRGVGRALVRRLHEAAGGEENIIMYTCANENATGFYEKLGMTKPGDVYVLNRAAWTDFTVE